MSRFTYQKWRKQESEQRILNALTQGDRSYTELLSLTELSKPVLSERLRSLEKQRKIASVADNRTRRFLHHLEYDSLTDSEKALTHIHNFSMFILRYLENSVNDKAVSDDEYSQMLLDGIDALLGLRMHGIFLAPLPEQEEWIKAIIGPEFAKKMLELLSPKNRNIYSKICEGLSPKEQALYKSKDAKETAAKLVESFNEMVERIQKLQKKRLKHPND